MVIHVFLSIFCIWYVQLRNSYKKIFHYCIEWRQRNDFLEEDVRVEVDL